MMNESVLHNLPDGWVWTVSSDVCSSVRDGTHDTPKYVEKGVPLITSKNLKDCSIDFSTAKNISIDDHEKISIRSGVENGDVLFAMIGTIGNPVVVQTKQIFSIKNVALFKKNEKSINSQYLKWWLSSWVFDTILKINMFLKGTTQKFIPLGSVRALPVPLPPLPEQRAIVLKLEQLFSDLDNSIENFKKAQAQLKLYRQSVLKNACEGKLVPTEAELAKAEGRDYEVADVLLERIKAEKKQLISDKKIKKTKENGEILKGEFTSEFPKNWKLSKIVDLGFVTKLAGFEYTKHIKLEDFGDVPVIRAQNVRMNYIDERQLKYIDMNISNLLKRCALTKKAILMTFIGAGIGDVAIFDKNERWHLAPNVAKIEPFNEYEEKIDIKYFLYYLMSSVGREEIFKFSKATAQPSLSMGTIRQVIVALPPLAEQRRIVTEVERRLSICDKMEATIAESLKKAESLHQSILKKAFEGKLLNEKELEEARAAPDWEPAGKLLERIKAEKINTQTKKKGKK